MSRGDQRPREGDRERHEEGAPGADGARRSAAIIAVGSELLGSERLDTNSLRLAAELLRHGFELRRKSVIGDREEDLAAEVAGSLGRVELLVLTGGLGPTADDVTKEAVARALGRQVRHAPEVLAEIEAKFRHHGLEMPLSNRRQAGVVEGATVLANARGTAPGQRLEAGGTTLFLFPGVPHELEGMIEEHLRPWLAERSAGFEIETRTLKVAAMAESAVEDRIQPAYGEFGREDIAVLARPGEIRLVISARGEAEARRERLDRMEARLAELVGRAVFARREEDTLESVVGELLRRRGLTVATAESCTGGLVAARITSVAGSSDYFPGGGVTYSNALKESLLGVGRDLLEVHGAVSEEVARAMATGARKALGASLGVAITGIAGPGGGSEEKPVGTVHLAVAGPGEGDVLHRKVRFPGDRERVRLRSVQLALELLRRRLLEVEEAREVVTDARLPEEETGGRGEGW